MNEYQPEGRLLKTEKNKRYLQSKEMLERAMDEGVILEGVATMCDHNLNLYVDLGCGIRAIMPRSEVEYSITGDGIKDIAILTRVGKPVSFKIISFERLNTGESVVVISRKIAQEECYQSYISKLIPGDIIMAKVTHLENFGAFIDLGCGITSLLSIDCISVSRIDHPKRRLYEGEIIYTVVKSIDEYGRISLSERELLGSWEENAGLFAEGETVMGIVRSVENYGVFIELTPNLAGLAEYNPDARVGQTAAVYIKSIIPEKMKIKLIIISLSESNVEYTPLEYFIDTDTERHIDFWQYSPSGAKKMIESIF